MIEIDVTYDDLDKLINKLERIPIRQYLKNLMMGAKKIVQAAYESQVFTGNEVFTASVRTTPLTATLTVRGEDVGFLEFGAGLATEWDEFASQVPYSVAPGSYSIWHGEKMGQFARTGLNFWYYQRVKYNAIPPTKGMQEAWETLQEIGGKYIKEQIEAWLFRYGDI